MKIAIIGSNGQLGTDLKEILSEEHDVTGLDHADIEITNIESVKNVLTTLKPDFLLNTAAYHVVPQCEQFPDKAFQINATGTLNLAKVCKDAGIKFLHYSTDYVFDGTKQKPYVEDDYCNPLNVYAASKLSGEHFCLELLRSIICSKNIRDIWQSALPRQRRKFYNYNDQTGKRET